MSLSREAFGAQSRASRYYQEYYHAFRAASTRQPSARSSRLFSPIADMPPRASPRRRSEVFSIFADEGALRVSLLAIGFSMTFRYSRWLRRHFQRTGAHFFDFLLASSSHHYRCSKAYYASTRRSGDFWARAPSIFAGYFRPFLDEHAIPSRPPRSARRPLASFRCHVFSCCWKCRSSPATPAIHAR